MITLFKKSAPVLLIVSLSINCFAVDGTDRKPTQINDLRYGQALYHFYQEQYFSSITDLMVAKQRAPITKQGIDPELLLGGLYLYYGLHQNASSIFSGLIENNTSQEIQDRAWFNIGKMNYQGHLYNSANESLNKIQDTLPPEREAERQNMLANTYLNNKDFAKAYDSLKKLKEHEDWEVYAQYNMGIALIKSGDAEEGTRLLYKISSLKTENDELKALRDKTNIAIGYAHLRNKQPQLSTKYLEQVRLKGPLSAKALLGIGWAYQQQDELEKALIPWMELRDWPVVDTAVQESLLAIPYTLEKLGKNQLALKHYSYAIENYKNELESIGDLLNSVKAGELLFALKPAMVTENTLATEYKTTLPKSISVPYLHHLLNSVDFQQVHKNYLDLIYLRKNLLKWKNQFPAYNLMLKERRHYYEKQLRTTSNDTRLTRINSLKKQRDLLANKVAKIEQQHDTYALATEDEEETLNSLNKIKYSLKRLAKKGDFSAEKEKYNLFKGLLLWDISTDYSPRYWKVKNELNQVDKLLEITNQRLQSLKQSSKDAPRAFSGFKSRIANNEEKLNTLLKKVTQILSFQEKQIETQALTSLQQRYHQIENYHIRAKYSLARLYDRLTLPANIKKNNTGSNK